MRLILAASVAAALSLAAAGGAPPKTRRRRSPPAARRAARSLPSARSGWQRRRPLVRINPRTNRVSEAHPRRPWRLLAHRGCGRSLDCELQAGPRPGASAQRAGAARITVGATPFDVLVAFERVWVTAWEDGKLAVVNPRTPQSRLAHRRRPAAGRADRTETAPSGSASAGSATAIARVDPVDLRRETSRSRRSSSRMVRRGRNRRPLDPGERRRPAAYRPGTAASARQDAVSDAHWARAP